MLKLHDLNRIAQYLENTIISMKSELKSKFFGPDEEAFKAQNLAHSIEIMELNKNLEIQQKAYKNMEVMLLKTQKLTEIKEQELNNEINSLKLNFHNTVTSKLQTDEKNSKLLEQKKLLIKEIKRLRNENNEIQHNLTQVESVNTKLFDTTIKLELQIKNQHEIIEKLKKEMELIEIQYKQREQTAVTAAVVATLDAVSKNNHTTSIVTTASTNTAAVEVEQNIHSEQNTTNTILTAAAITAATTTVTTCSTENTPVQLTEVNTNTNTTNNNTTTTDTNTHTLTSPITIQNNNTESSSTEQIQYESDTTPLVVLSTQEVQDILQESQTIMASLRPLPGNKQNNSLCDSPTGSIKSTTSGNGSGGSFESPRACISASTSGSNLVGSIGRDRQISVESSNGKLVYYCIMMYMYIYIYIVNTLRYTTYCSTVYMHIY